MSEWFLDTFSWRSHIWWKRGSNNTSLLSDHPGRDSHKFGVSLQSVWSFLSPLLMDSFHPEERRKSRNKQNRSSDRDQSLFSVGCGRLNILPSWWRKGLKQDEKQHHPDLSGYSSASRESPSWVFSDLHWYKLSLVSCWSEWLFDGNTDRHNRSSELLFHPLPLWLRPSVLCHQSRQCNGLYRYKCSCILSCYRPLVACCARHATNPFKRLISAFAPSISLESKACFNWFVTEWIMSSNSLVLFEICE